MLIDLKLQGRIAGTMWAGLDLDEVPEQGASPFPYLTLRQVLALSVVC